MKKYYFGIYKSGGGKIFGSDKNITKKSFRFYEKVLGPMLKETAIEVEKMCIAKFGNPKKKRKRNPGSVWHSRKGSEARRLSSQAMEDGRRDEASFHDGERSAHIQSRIVSDSKGMPNPRRRSRNPGARYHATLGRFHEEAIQRTTDTERIYHIGRRDAHVESMKRSDRLGINPSCNPCRNPAHRHYRRLRLRRNPAVGTEIYDRITAIEATKGDGSLWPREPFRHDFKDGGKIIGLPNGDLLIKRRSKKLWKDFDY